MATTARHRTLGKKLIRIFIKSVLYFLLFFLVIVVLVMTPPVQRLLKKKFVAYLENRLDTKVTIGSIRISLPKNIVLKDFYLEDRQGDTLITAGNLKMDIALLKLAFRNELIINKIELSDSKVKIRRQALDSAFNYQFVFDAFAPKTDSTATTDSTSSSITINKIELDNIHLVYKDAVSGSDANIRFEHFDTRLGKIDPDRLHFEIPQTSLEGMVADIYQTKPLTRPESYAKDVAEAREPSAMYLGFKKIDLSRIKLNFRNDVSAAYMQLDLGDMNINMNDFDLQRQVIDIEEISLKHTNSHLRLGKKEAAVVLAKEAEKEITTRLDAGWRVIARKINIENNSIRFDNDNERPVRNGMDYFHLAADSFNLAVNDFLFSNDSIGGNIESASFREKSGFVLNQLQTDFLYSDKEAYVKDLYLKTPGTELKRKAAITYPSPQSLATNIGQMYMDADIIDSRVRVSDILTFVPSLQQSPAFSNPHATLYVNSRFHGTLDAIQIEALQVQGLHETNIDVRGNITGLLSGKNPSANLAIRNISTSQRDISYFVPLNNLPTNVTLPSRISLNGNIASRGNALLGDLHISSSLGVVSAKGEVASWKSPETIRYNAAIQTSSFNAGTFLRNSQIPDNISASFTINGTGTSPQTMNADLAGRIESAIIKQYNYRNIAVKAGLHDQHLTTNLRLNDPNIDVTADAKANLSEARPSLIATVMIDSIKFKPLHLTRTNIIYRGKLEADFPVADLAAPQGNLLVTQSLLVQEEKRFELDTMQVQAGVNDKGKFITLNSALANASVSGQYDLAELPAVFTQAIQPYFRITPTFTNRPTKPYDFLVDATITNNKAWSALLPDLQRMQPVTMNGHFSTQQGWTAAINAPLIEINNQRLSAFQATAATSGDSLAMNISLDHFYVNKTLQLGSTTLAANAANNNLTFQLTSRDRLQRDKYNLQGNFVYNGQNNYALSLQPGNLLLNYEQWTINAGNRVTFTNNDINVNDFVLSNGSQQLRIQSNGTQRNAPLEANFTNFRLLTLTGLVQADSTLADGVLNGRFTLDQLTPRPVFTSDITVNDLRIKNDTTGNLRLQVNNRNNGNYQVSATLTGRGNDVTINGNYQPFADGNSLELDLALQQLSMKTVQAFSNDMIYNGSGTLSGNFKVRGSIAKPSINGDLNFDKTVFAIKNLNDRFTIDNEKLTINEEGLQLNSFIIKDSAGNEMRLNGKIATTDFQHFKFDTRLRSTNFRLVNSTKKGSKYFYGQMYVDANLTITGDETLPIIDGRLMVNDKTNMTLILPQKEPQVVRRDGIVEFVSFNSPNDSLFLTTDSIYADFFTGADVSVTIETSKEADFTLVIDEGNGDFIHIKGTTQLTAGSDRSGRLTLSGTFELESGAYELSFNLLKRRFDIEKGSRITWEGEPTKATVDVTAKYIANVPPLDLVKNQLVEATTSQRNTYLQRLPFEVILHMEGSLMEPVFSFNITLPNDKSYGVSQDIITNVQTRLEQLRLEEGDMNKQVFALLLLNRFVADNPFSGMSNPFDPGRFARQSVSRLLTEQLNRLAGDLIAGVELHFDVESYEDYSTGEKSNRTDLNIGLSKRLLSDRLTVTVGSNFAIEGTNSNQQANNLIGDVALDYKISRDGRYLLRTYRKTEYYGVLEGYVIETGVGFIVAIDYNRFREIFQSSKRRLERQRQRELKRNQEQ